jgi:hypothetical protein
MAPRPLSSLLLLLPLACGDNGARDETSTTNTATAGTTQQDPTTGTTTSPPTTSDASQTAGETTSTTTTTTGPASSTGPGDSTDATSTTTGTSTGAPACEDQPEECDALDNNCNDLFDEGCDCTPPDLDLTAIDGYTARVVLTVDKDLGPYGRLGDVERALGDYWGMPGEGVLFTLNNAAETAGGIGRMDQDGKFLGWVVDPASAKLPPNPYLEYAYGGILYSCTTVAGDWIYKIYPDGTVETVVHHGNCEGIVFGDRGDGQERLYASNYSESKVYTIGEDNSRTELASGLTIVVDLAIPHPSNTFATGLYAINQTIAGTHRIAPDNKVTLDYPYTLGYGVGEEISFANPKSAFRDYFYHLSATLQAVVRVAPDGSWEKVITGPKLNYGLYSTGAVFSSNGAYYFFTNEDNLVMRLQACNAAGQ